MSKKANLTLAKTPAPKADRIHGSARNPRGSASSTTKAAKIKLGKTTTDVLRDKLQDFKIENPDKRNVTLGDLKAVYRRGSGAYSASHRPTITGGKPNSRAAWSYARVNKFLQKAAGKRVKKAYVQDDDLLKRGGKISEDNVTVITYHEQDGNWLFQKNLIYVWVYEDMDAAKKLETGEYDWLLFPPSMGMYASFQKGFIPPLLKVWNKRFQKDIKGSEKAVGVAQGWYDEKASKLYVEMMTTRKDVRRQGVNSLMIKTMRDNFGLEKEDVIFDKPTAEGKKFAASGKYELGGGLGEEIECSKCHWHWNTNDSDTGDKYVCHKCGYNNANQPMPDSDKTDTDYARGGGVGGKKKTDMGDCYFVAGRVALDNQFKNGEKREFIGTPYLVHAEVRGQGALTGIRYGHAWVEDDVLVYDNSNNRTLVVPKQYYYMVGDIQTDDPKKYRRYTFEEARNKMAETGNYGCWDIEVEYAKGGITDKIYDMSKIQLPDMESDYETLEPILAKQGYELRRVLRATKSVEEIADAFNVPKYYVERELKRGTSVELEHTEREDVAREIALHHLAESPDYYINLSKIEGERKPVAAAAAADGGYYKRGGEINPDDSKIKNAVTHKAGSAGGLLVGNRHSEGGIKAINKSTGQPLEMEGGEVVITRNAVSDNQKREFEGEMLSNREILSRINEGGGGVSFAKGGNVPHKCSCSGREYRYGGKLMRDNDIVKNILDAYADMYDFAGDVVKQPLHFRKYGMGGTVSYASNRIPTLRGFATAVGVPNVLMLRGRYSEYLKNEYNISFTELPHLLKSALLLGNQKLVDSYTKR
jgi:hypothetical protein